MGVRSPGDSSFIEVIVVINKFAFGGTASKVDKTNKADVLAGGDINPSNNEDEDTVEIRRLPDLKIEKATGDKFEVGSVARYILTVTNQGSGNADGGVTVIDNLPAGLRFMSVLKPQFWTCSVAGRTITCVHPGRFDAGASDTIQIVVGVTSSASPSVTNVAQVQAPGDYDLSNNGPIELPTPVTQPTIDEDLPCGVTEVEGWLEPSQGVWQDDYTFANKLGKRLVQASPTLFLADLAMVRERATLLFGIFDPVGGQRLDRRDQIMTKGKTNGSTNVPVKVRFTLIQGGAVTPLHETEVRNLPFGEPCTSDQPFEFPVDATEGIPPANEPPFTFGVPGPYKIEAEIVHQDGRPTGIKVSVAGIVRNIPTLVTHFVPVIISNANILEEILLKALTDRLADDSAVRIPDYYPLPPRGFSAVKAPRVQDMSVVADKVIFFPSNRQEAIRAAIIRQMQGGALLAGAQRVVVVMRDVDFDQIRFQPPFFKAAAFAPSQKVVYTRSPRARAGFLNIDADVVAHELVHTMPHLWTSDDMEAECDIDYHNSEDPVAHGHRILEHGQENRKRMRDEVAIMGPAGPATWITQCTYAHLLDQLVQLPDPLVLLVQGLVFKSGDMVQGDLSPAYQLDGTVDLKANNTGGWAILLRDAGGNIMGRYPFDPVFTIADPDTEINLVPFAYRLPYQAEVAQIDLVFSGDLAASGDLPTSGDVAVSQSPSSSGDFLLDSITLSANAPTVVIEGPASGGTPSLSLDGTVSAVWTGDDADGDLLLYTVLYSSDGGQNWSVVSFEQEGTSADVSIDPAGTEHRVKVIVTDDARSAEAVASFFILLTDVNGDGVVNGIDLWLVSGAMGTRPGDSGYRTVYDVNRDFVIDILDIAEVAATMLSSPPPSGSMWLWGGWE